MSSITAAERRALKGRAQRLEPIAFVGKQGLSDALVRSVDEALAKHELVKVKFVEFKEEKDQLASELAEKTGSELVTRIGHVAVLFRRKPAS